MMPINEQESQEEQEIKESPASFAESLDTSLGSSSPAEGEGAPPTAPSPGLEPAEPPLYQQYAERLGFQEAADEKDFYERVAEHIALQEDQQRQLAELAQQRHYQAQQYYQELSRQQQAQQGQFAPQQQPAQPASWWSPPSVDEQIARKYLTTNQETGQTEWRPDTPIEVRQNYEKLQAYREDWARQLLYNPTEAASRLWEGEFQKRIEETLTQREQAQRQQWEQQQAIQAAQQIQQQHASWIYQPDPQNPARPYINPYTGQPQPTPQGALLMENLQLIDQARNGDPGARFQAATLMALGRMYAGQQAPGQAQPAAQPAPPPVSPAQQKKQQHRQQAGANRLENRGGSLTHANGGGSQNKHLSFAQSLAAALDEAGQ
jgi:hypothetical protein